jgi:hypothetical protein
MIETQRCYSLKFSSGNAKLDKRIASISLPSGFTCPGALECLSKANRETGKITDGPETLFRCFSATSEAAFPSVRSSRWGNFELLKECATLEEMVDLILESLPKQDIIRIHVGGDFFNQLYFDAWLEVSRRCPDKIFYAYTKSLKFWIARISVVGHAGTENFKLTASRGGKQDDLISELGLKEAVVVFSEEEAEKLGLEIDHDDTHAFESDESFALLLHGTQPKGSGAADALKVLKKKGKGSYSSKKKKKWTDTKITTKKEVLASVNKQDYNRKAA